MTVRLVSCLLLCCVLFSASVDCFVPRNDGGFKNRFYLCCDMSFARLDCFVPRNDGGFKNRFHLCYDMSYASVDCFVPRNDCVLYFAINWIFDFLTSFLLQTKGQTIVC